MKVCLISNQIAEWGKIGGFGTATRAIGKGLAEKGIETCAVIPQRASDGQKKVEILDGIKVFGTGKIETMLSGKIFKEIDADIYHSQEPTIASYLAQKACPNAIHIVTCRDPRSLQDHLIELRHTNYKRRLLAPVTWYYEASPWVRKAVQNASAVFSPAPTCLNEKIKELYKTNREPKFVPSPIDLPTREPQKSPEPLAIFVGRWDHRKRIERFFELAKNSPDVKFMAIGRAHDKAYDRHLRETYGDIPNVEMPGFIPRFGNPGINDIYQKAWIIVNTSAREGLPYTFLEATAFGCAILSDVNPDEFASSFGYFVEDDDFEKGLAYLLTSERWQKLGQKAAGFVQETFSEENSIREHLKLYKKLT